jgi:DNA-binding response OmpR family regulator
MRDGPSHHEPPERRALVVDDDTASRTVLRLACESIGVEAVEAATGIAALQVAVTTAFAVILLDLGLPDVTGLEVCRRLRAQDVRTPIIVVSAHSAAGHMELALAAGADDYIGKPYRLAQLLTRVRAYADAGDTGVRLTGLPVPGLPVQRRRGATAGDGARHADGPPGA